MKTIAYAYLFNYFGESKYNEKTVTGAGIDLAIRCYKDGKEVKFDEVEPYAGAVSVPGSSSSKHYLNSVFSVSIDRNTVFKISRNLYADNLFRIVNGYDSIECDVVGYYLDVSVGPLKNRMPSLAEKLPTEFEDSSVSESIDVTESAFREFVLSNIDGFDISDNKNAQCPAMSFIE